MFTGWNLSGLLVFCALYSQGAGFWPFQILTATDSRSAEVEASAGGIKRVAIIGTLLVALLV